MISTCALYGGTTYVNSWLSINVLVILVSLLIVAIAYSLSSIMPNPTREKIKGAVRSELVQALISTLIIVILLGTAAAACSISASESYALNQKSMNPFAYADYYIGNLSVNTGLNLLTTIYSTSISYSVESQVLTFVGSLFSAKINKVPQILKSGLSIGGVVSISVAFAVHIGIIFDSLSTLYLAILAPLVTIAVGLLFIQFLLIPLLQYTAFTIVLPVALAVRSISFMGNSLRNASNAMLAIAIAAYIVYPLTIVFNGYAVAWIFSSSNPSFQYLHATYIVPNIPINKYFSAAPTTSNGISSTLFSTLAPLVYNTFSLSSIINLPLTIVSQSQMLITETAQFLFSAIVLIIIDLSITIGFAAGLTHALDGGLEGAGTFWSGI